MRGLVQLKFTTEESRGGRNPDTSGLPFPHLAAVGKRSTFRLSRENLEHMMRLEYAGGEVLVSDALCHALLDYSAAVARGGGSEDFQIPVVTADGLRGLAEVVIGPASQLLATPTDVPEVDLDDDGIVKELIARAAALQTPKVIPSTEPVDQHSYDDLL
jgi:hypothetical protein